MLRITFAFTFIGLATTSFGQSQTLGFFQTGYSKGAIVTGSFVGEDLDFNSQLNAFDGETTDFDITFSGNSIVTAFSLDFDDLFGLVYESDGGHLAMA